MTPTRAQRLPERSCSNQDRRAPPIPPRRIPRRVGSVNTVSHGRLQPRAAKILSNVLIYLDFVAIGEGVAAGCAGGVAVQPWPSCPCTTVTWTRLSDSTRETPVIMSTLRRSPRTTFLHWVRTTPP